MTGLQKLFTSIVPRQWAADMEAESRAWQIKCGNCGFEKSVWDSGGIRWKAAGTPRRYIRCANCGQLSWHTIHK